MYELNEVLVYGNNGVCKVVDIRKEKFTGSPAMYYILSPVFGGQSTLYVPIENTALSSKLRPVMLKETLDEMLTEAKASEAKWENNDKARGEQFHTVVSNGLSSELLTVLKSLVIHRNELKNTVKKLHNSDERTLALCEKIVGEEYAYAFGVDVDDALSHIEGEFTAA
ncbi:MAG: CarD family transcriptional regulator [Clostridia bacterium]|nr:CarD family transcriptional regulator [Clostridia bacterium]